MRNGSAHRAERAPSVVLAEEAAYVLAEPCARAPRDVRFTNRARIDLRVLLEQAGLVDVADLVFILVLCL